MSEPEVCGCSTLYPHYKVEHRDDCDGGPCCGGCMRCIIMQVAWYSRMEEEGHA